MQANTKVWTKYFLTSHCSLDDVLLKKSKSFFLGWGGFQIYVNTKISFWLSIDRPKTGFWTLSGLKSDFMLTLNPLRTFNEHSEVKETFISKHWMFFNLWYSVNSFIQSSLCEVKKTLSRENQKEFLNFIKSRIPYPNPLKKEFAIF